MKNKTFDDLILSIENLAKAKTKQFDLLDDEEEFVVTKQIDDAKRDQLAKKFKTLYIKAREIKSLVSDYAQMNGNLKNMIFEYRNENQRLANENDELQAKFENTSRKVENNQETLLRDLTEAENKWNEAERERAFLVQKLEEMQR